MKNIKEIAEKLDKLFPNAKSELYFNNEFQLLIAIIMSAQTTNKQVNKINKIFFKKFKTPRDLVSMGQEKIKNEIRALGLYNSKARNIFLTSKMLLENYNEKIPDDINELQKLPGVGIKTAKVWLSIARNKPYLAVDTHVHRVLNRLGIVETKTPLQTDKIISQKLKLKNLKNLHYTLVLFGRYYCTARNPKCKRCELFDLCQYKNIKNL